MDSRFTPAAEVAWGEIPECANEKLLSAVWCPHCRRATTMTDFGGEVERRDLVLHGRCASCWGEVARVIEGE